MRHPWSAMAKSVFALAIGAVLAVSTGSACARDAAARRIIGFSPDGAYFEGRDRRFMP
jgi:hypothetical protein